MALIPFVRNHDDLSTDRGYQFKFYCDRCGNGYLSRFQPSAIGTAGSLLRAAGDLFGGWASSAGNSAYEVQRAVGGKAHDDALQKAVEEGKQHFHQCSRCGKWVCPEVCWNAGVGQCEECAPDYQEELASSHAHAKAEASREQLHEKARATDYASKIDMSAEAQVRAPVQAAGQQAKAVGPTCASCGAETGKAKFCPECGTPTKPARPTCVGCGHQPESATKFCPECGAKMPLIG
ncbi:MAG TPA: zinc ribbon domain-containing protein [Pyrinomonadaceae bacterium]|jgi:membrane protease subunit (stomatin/prohibitin family)|nr:zinc ribbon domain-containing protein [Pyrinomonadaceae bacterium]